VKVFLKAKNITNKPHEEEELSQLFKNMMIHFDF